jgi:hypothetical protein
MVGGTTNTIVVSVVPMSHHESEVMASGRPFG